MSEGTSTDDKSKSAAAPRKKTSKKAAVPSPPPPDAGGFTGWRTWALIGCALVGGVIVWKIAGSTYKGDIETICNSEAGSGFTMEKDTSKVTAYIRQHLATPEGNTFYSSLSDAKLAERAKKLEGAATDAHAGACPLVASFQKMAASGEYRADVVHLCATLSFPHLAEMDDDARLKAIEDWIDRQAKSPRTKELAEPLRQGTGAGRAKLLRDTAQALDVFSCDTARTLEGPVVPARVKGPPTVQLFGQPQIVGDLPATDLGKTLLQINPALTQCYASALDKKPELDGKLAMKIKIDPNGKVVGAQPAEVSALDRGVADCFAQVLKGSEMPKNPGPLVSVLLPFEVTTMVAPPPAPGGSGSAAPGSRPPAPAPATSKH
jgi:hypothetical protein